MTDFISRISRFILLLSIPLYVQACSEPSSDFPDWAIGEFIRPSAGNPVLRPDTAVVFNCPMRKCNVHWMESDTFNPAATVRNGKIALLFRAEDNSATGIGMRTSRIGLAYSEDGITMEVSGSPVLFPAEDSMKRYEWPGGCEDPRIAMTEEGTYIMMYTSWNRDVPRLCSASSKDLVNWTKHGPVFASAYNGKFADTASKSASLVTRITEDGRQVIAKVNGKYTMYWGEQMINIATSDDLINWTPEVNADGELKGTVFPRDGYFDSMLTECGPPAVLTKDGIVLMYNGKNRYDNLRDPNYASGTYSAGQILFDSKDPSRVLARLDKPFFKPEEAFEKSGQYTDGTVFIEGLVYFEGKWYLYYGCADSFVGVAVCKAE